MKGGFKPKRTDDRHLGKEGKAGGKREEGNYKNISNPASRT